MKNYPITQLQTIVHKLSGMHRPFLRLSFFIGSLLLATLIACQTEGPETERTPAPTIQSPSLVPQEVPITTLLRNPASFDGQTIWVTGQYRALPLLVCGGTTHRSPATWTLVFGDVETFVSGFDEALRPLAASGLSLTIEGRWQKWEGPVGCGRRAPSQELWYLAASRIVSPNPLVKSDEDGEIIVLVPSPTAEIEVIEQPTSGPTGEEEPTPGPEEEGDTPTLSPSPTFQSIPSPLPGPTNTPSPSPTTGTTGGEGNNTGTPTPTASATLTATNGTAASETGTPTSTASATPTTTGNTPGATATPADQGVLGFDLNNNEKKTLSANSPHSWRLNPPADVLITITAGSSSGLNVNIDLVAPDGTVVVKANANGAGKAEVITYTPPNPTGEYKVIISGEGGTSGDYILMAFDDESVPFVVIRDTINYGSGGSGNNAEFVDHLWNFSGQAGDVISIEVSTTSNTGDLIFYLIGPDGSELEIVDDTIGFGNEELTDYTLPATGFYSIGIGESNFDPIAYSMTLIGE